MNLTRSGKRAWLGTLIAVAAASGMLAACGGSATTDPAAGTGGGSSGGGGSASGGVTGGGTGGGSASGGTVGDAGVSCPTDPASAEGQPCANEGQWCSYGVPAPCSFGNSLVCSGGKWERVEAHPDPNCDEPDDTYCGGLAGLMCPADQWCDMGGCDFDDSFGLCRDKPQGCFTDCPGVCGCDGKFYCNACMANAAGVGVSKSTQCMQFDAGSGG